MAQHRALCLAVALLLGSAGIHTRAQPAPAANAATQDVTLPKVTARAKGSRLGGIRPGPQPCPEGLPAEVQCLAGQDYLGAWFWMALPKDWNGVLVLHTHDGPELGEPDPERSARDMAHWSAWLRAGYAWAGSSYREGGFDTENAAEDSERVRQAFIAEFGEPQQVLLHGHGWGAPVAARMAQRYTTPDIHPRRPSSGKRPYDAVLLSNGLLAGARGFDAWLDLRVLYQALCANHPLPTEEAYPLWMGLPVGNKLSAEALSQRVNDCTGLQRKPSERSPAQQKVLTQLTRLSRIPEAGLMRQLQDATWGLQHLVWQQLGGKSALGNEAVVYGGASDAALNQQLPRYKIDAQARGALEGYADPGGLIHIPVLSLHAVDDPVVFVEQQASWKAAMEEAGTGPNLLQLYLPGGEHDRVPEAQLLAAAKAVLGWAASGQKPNPAAIPGRWLNDYRVAELATRSPERRPVAARQATPQVLGVNPVVLPPAPAAALPRRPLDSPAP
jgi:alpha-beta hydrolase superfamily lysophospholipase